jgi:hypothetical protein
MNRPWPKAGELCTRASWHLCYVQNAAGKKESRTRGKVRLVYRKAEKRDRLCNLPAQGYVSPPRANLIFEETRLQLPETTLPFS